jgi:hypothetical protein
MKSQRDLLLAFGAFLIAFILWQFNPFSPVVYPLRLFVTFIHELGHGTVALLTGGKFLNFQVMPSGAGLAYTSGGFRPAIIAAGYIGTAIFGAVLLYTANRSAQPQRISILLGVVFAVLTLIFTGLRLSNIDFLEILISLAVIGGASYFFVTLDTGHRYWRYAGMIIGAGLLLLVAFAAGGNLLTVMVGVTSGLALIWIGRRGDRDLNLFTLNFLAFMVGLNAITDSWILFRIVSSELVVHNDASSMAREVAFSAQFWAATWIAIAVACLGTSIWLTFIRPWRASRQS